MDSYLLFFAILLFPFLEGEKPMILISFGLLLI